MAAVCPGACRAVAVLVLVVVGGCGSRGDDAPRATVTRDVSPAQLAVDSAPAPAPAPAAAMAPAPVAPAPAAPAAVAPAVAAPTAAMLVMKPATLRPGMSSIITFDVALDLDLNFGGVRMNTSSKQSKRKKMQIVSLDADGTVHKRIAYLKRDTRIMMDGELRKDETPIRGKTFLVTWKDAVIDVRRANGKPATEEEIKAVRAEEGQLGAPEWLGKALVGLPLVEGKPFEVPVAAIERLFNGEYRPRRVVLTYLGMSGDNARIDAEAALANDGEGTKFFLDLKAELLVDPTGWCLDATVAAQVRAELSGAVVGSGAGTGKVTATPLR
jgi:hypothetical protein